LAKLLLDEQERAALAAWLADHANLSRITSGLAMVEVIRACRRSDENDIPRALGADLTAFVTYDRRLQAAAEAEALPVVAPA
jgi:hypothetical protein